MKRLCVFCGSSSGFDPAFGDSARAFGKALAQAGLGLVYGGGNVVLMGVLADATLNAGGSVIGVIPEALKAREIAHHGLDELHVTSSMHTRKQMMADLSDGFVALPGGIGTFEELFEIWTWGQLGDHMKPVGLLNVAGFYDPLIAFLDQVAAQGFLKPEHRSMLLTGDDPDRLIATYKEYRAFTLAKWIGPGDR